MCKYSFSAQLYLHIWCLKMCNASFFLKVALEYNRPEYTGNNINIPGHHFTVRIHCSIQWTRSQIALDLSQGQCHTFFRVLNKCILVNCVYLSDDRFMFLFKMWHDEWGSSGTWPHPHDVCDTQKCISEDLPLATCQDLRCYIAEHLNTGRLVSNGSSEKKEI